MWLARHWQLGLALLPRMIDILGSIALFLGFRSTGTRHIFHQANDRYLRCGAGLVLLSPLFLGIALAIKHDSPVPAFSKQTHVGRYGKFFSMWKFRSMYIDTEARRQALLTTNEMTAGVLFKMKDDPRITKIGRFTRRTSIDELPQLWNVLWCEMSLVGPRPALPSEVNQYSLEE
ncbi:hypothetical protein CCP3SC1_440020 [Gammaproteobacteria bacterium]